MKLIPVIGLEIHAELLTNSKVFCRCANRFGEKPNTHICPVCTGQPGALPTLNGEAVNFTVRAGLALNCTINEYSRFDRKNYTYADLPKAYQVSQVAFPLCTNGSVELSTGTVVGIRQIHLEEDTCKLIHDDYSGVTLADFNRSSVPLIEIVSAPDIKTAEEAVEYVNTIAERVKYAGVCDAKMQEGSLRADINISLKEEGSSELGNRVEIKNLNSTRSIVRAIEFEIKRHTELIEAGERVPRQTRRFDENMGVTVAMRSKEESVDYRVFPEPDIPAVVLTANDIEDIRAQIPLLPHKRREVYVGVHGLSEKDAFVITQEKYISDFYDEAAAVYNNYKNVASFMLTEVLRHVKDTGSIPFSAADFAEAVKMADTGIINRLDAKAVLKIMFDRAAPGDNSGVAPQSPMDIARENGFIIEQDDGAMKEFIDRLLIDRADLVEQYRAGKTNALGYFMGQAAGALKGKATPQAIREYLEGRLNN